MHTNVTHAQTLFRGVLCKRLQFQHFSLGRRTDVPLTNFMSRKLILRTHQTYYERSQREVVIQEARFVLDNPYHSKKANIEINIFQDMKEVPIGK